MFYETRRRKRSGGLYQTVLFEWKYNVSKKRQRSEEMKRMVDFATDSDKINNQNYVRARNGAF